METTIGSSYREVQETEGSRSRDSTVQRCRSKTPGFLFMRILINRTWAFFCVIDIDIEQGACKSCSGAWLPRAISAGQGEVNLLVIRNKFIH